MIPQTFGAWTDAMAEAPVAPGERLIGAGALVVLAPHPDDETIGASGLILAAVREGRPVGLVALTDGEGSHRASATHPPARLAELRRAEQAAALERLGVPGCETLRLGLPDGASRHDPRFAAAPAAVAAFCERIGASALAAPHPGDPHPDHLASGDLALAVRTLLPSLRILFYEVWSKRHGPDAAFRTRGLTPFRVRTDVRMKLAALECHASQLGRVVADDPSGFALPDWFLANQSDPLERVSVLAMPGNVPGASHFAALYADGGDPWHVRSSAYEAQKREASVGLLAGRRATRALEIGCGEGYLTRALLAAGVAEAVVGVDRDPGIVARARGHAETTGAATFVTGSMPDDLPDGRFDLVVLSEVLYFLDEAGLARLVETLVMRLGETATILVVCYLGPTGTPLSGRDAGDLFVALCGDRLRRLTAHETPDYRAEAFEWRRAFPEAREDAPEGQTAAAEAGRESG